ncbi:MULTISPECIES: NUDIX domain-containing protein [unclassified Paenibacillus]|uniref:NUDIX domain-containing protein n=1 Tax=unclassified Paenibacillus TaxID=185978 RepID=UPI0009A6E991|nr:MULTISPECIES: NUDIX domain-containing protein [unclassified Paenibacillus]SLK13192.1 NUDIX domain-containing protein [Paenibacillus sp. RU5A]SOC72939.1 NUDIX domain-containing protein [Paenibacillus sp. RU26A]SOC75194.1 NUDIX domain-containing protein [Paenibacillus sp. RU5M]
MTSRIVVTGGAIIRDHMGRILLQKRSDYGDWGLPGGGMEPGESIEETMIREVKEETGLDVSSYELASIYTGEKMKYTYPDGNEVVFVMFLFNVTAELGGKLDHDQTTLLFKDEQNESLELFFKSLDEIDISTINKVQKPVLVDLMQGELTILR